MRTSISKFALLLIHCFLVDCLFIDQAFAAKVKVKRKKYIVVQMDEGEEWEKGAKVCFFNKKNRKVACGKIKGFKGKRAYVLVKSKKRKKRIRKGMVVAPADAPPTSAEDSEKTEQEAESKTPTETEATEGETPTEESSTQEESDTGLSQIRVRFQWAPAIRSASVYQKVVYDADAAGESPSSTWWKQNELVNISTVGFAVQAAFGIGKFSVNPGLRYRVFETSQIAADYDTARLNLFVETKQESTSLGIFVDFDYLRMPFGTSELDLFAGLDIEMSTLKFTATFKDDSEEQSNREIAKADSKLNVVSLRLGTTFDAIFLKPFGTTAGLTLLVPLASFGKSVSASMDDTLDDGQTAREAPDDDSLAEALDHKKGSFAAELILGVVLGF